MAKISVIIPIYNAEKYLKQCVRSVLDQTLKDIEIICVNDGSKDGSKDIIDALAKSDNRIKVIHKENSGYGASMNMGLAAATGEYIGIVESDDFIEPDMYEELYELSEGGRIDVVKSNFWDCYDEKNGTITRVENHERDNMPKVKKAFTAREYPQILWGHPSIWTGIYKRKMLTENKILFKEAKGGGWVDNPFFFQTMYAAKSIKWTTTPYYCYRKTNENSSSIGYDLKIPFERMSENLDISEQMHHLDEETRKVLYARALMYTVGATQEPHYGYNEDYARPFMQKMLAKLDPNIIDDDFNVWDKMHFYRYRSPLLDVMPKQAKILIYNWVPFDNPYGAGGGVTVYCRNLILSILRNRPDVQVYFLSSGWAYDINKAKSYIRKTGNIYGDRCRSFELVNSPVPAAQDMLFYNPTVAYNNKNIKDLFDEFLDKNGPFNCVHFNNIEGISLDVLDLKKKYSSTKFIYSMHNYVPICMTGFYFRRDKKVNCDPNHTAEDCGKCINRDDKRGVRKELLKRALVNAGNKEDYNGFDWIEQLGLGDIDEIKDSKYLFDFATRAKQKINTNMDLVLAVSERVRKIALENGIDDRLVRTGYIGTKIASYQVGMSLAEKTKYFKIAFLGTDINNTEKGYPFLLDALSGFDKEKAARTDVLLSTTVRDQDDYIRRKLKRFHKVEIIHGYKHAELTRILKGVHLGIIPVLWEDNLPQVAIEMVALGVPILSSSAGGAQELCSSEKFVFNCGSIADFHKKLGFFVDNKAKVKEYWAHHDGLKTLNEHFNEMSEYYELPEPAHAVISVEDYAKILDENGFLYRYFGNGRSPEEERYVAMENELLGCHGVIADKENEIKKLQEYIEHLHYVIDETRKSKSYKLGLAITEIPRKLRGKIG